MQVLAVFIDYEFRPEGALRQTLRMIETAWRIAEGCPDAVRLCRTGDDIRAALADDTIAAVLALEGCEAVIHRLLLDQLGVPGAPGGV